VQVKRSPLPIGIPPRLEINFILARRRQKPLIRTQRVGKRIALLTIIFGFSADSLCEDEKQLNFI